MHNKNVSMTHFHSAAQNLPIKQNYQGDEIRRMSIVKEEIEESKMLHESRIFINPHRQTKPLVPKDITKGRQQQSVYFKSHFDLFSLPFMFSNKILEKQQIQSLLRESQSVEKGYFTPTTKHKTDEALLTTSNFSKVDICGINGLDTEVNQKKSRPREKGLRKLSNRAYQIVKQMETSSYKQVANQLVNELSNEEEIDREGKDEQNIKRRVYDALNVLIALGVLKKEGRKIVRSKFSSFQSSVLMLELKQKLSQKEGLIARKKEQLQLLKKQFDTLSFLINRNKNNQNSTTQKMNIPFLVVRNENSQHVQIGRNDCGTVQKLLIRWNSDPNDYRQYGLNHLIQFQSRLLASH